MRLTTPCFDKNGNSIVRKKWPTVGAEKYEELREEALCTQIKEYADSCVAVKPLLEALGFAPEHTPLDEDFLEAQREELVQSNCELNAYYHAHNAHLEEPNLHVTIKNIEARRKVLAHTILAARASETAYERIESFLA